MPPKPRPVADRFWAKVDMVEGDGCWNWLAYVHPVGYGHFGIGVGDTDFAHRMSWRLTYGPIPPGMYVLHHCDNRLCVRPDHLFLGKQKDNMVDMSRKGRSYRARVTAAQVLEIRALLAEGLLFEREIAAKFGISRIAVNHIGSRRSWAWL